MFVNIMEQYHPDAYVGRPKRGRRSATGDDEHDEGEGAGAGEVRYADINHAVAVKEVSAVHQTAEKAGLWRFCDPPGHDGFNI